MKKMFWRALFFLVPFLYSIYVCSQPPKERDCNTTCFSSEMVVVERSSTCTTYEVKVSFTGDCAHALSHYTVAVPCGEVTDVWNSEDWKQVIGTDPTTGLSGFKIDDISDFGESDIHSFTAGFTVCSTGASCNETLKCWQPTVAYKASTCVNYETVAIECNLLKASLQAQDVTCFGAADGALQVLIEDGEEPFTFEWSNQSTEQSVTGLTAGEYSVIVRDASGSEVILQETIQEPEAITLQETITPATCNGLANGSISLQPSGGTPPYTVSWADGRQGATLTELAAGRYISRVTDSKGCSVTRIFSIVNSSTLDATVSMVKPDCNSQNGSIDISVSGGTQPYTFRWSTGHASEDVSPIGSGLYSVTITDAAGCSVEKSVLLRDNNTLSITGIPTAAACSGEATGSIDVTVRGGVEPYTYEWSNGEVTQDLTGLSAGKYSLTVYDSKGCSATLTFSVSTTTFHVARTIVQPSCLGASDGSITLHEPVGGTTPYTYEWSTGDTGTSLTGLGAGSYSVTITDAAGCTRTYSINVAEPEELTAAASVSSSECKEEGSYAIDLAVSGGSPPYSFQWSTGETTQERAGLISGSYTVAITDANGCTTSKEVLIEHTEASLACMITEPLSPPVCNSSNNTLTASVSDADSYSWTVLSADPAWSITSVAGASVYYTAGIANSSATFTLAITKDGCTKTCTYTIEGCTSDESGGEPGGENPGDDGDETCEECFESVAKVIAESDGCRTYEIQVSTNGLCRYELSHLIVGIPCGNISDYSNSGGWKMEVGLDPTTAVYGLKVDDISSLGKEVDSFSVRFTVCESSLCSLGEWVPSVAYKAAQCVSIQSLGMEETTDPVNVVSAYPNPFEGFIYMEWSVATDYYTLEIIDQYGNVVIHAEAATASSLRLDASALPKGMYYYRLAMNGKSFSGKLSKR